MKVRRIVYLLLSAAALAALMTPVAEAGGGAPGPLIAHHSLVKPYFGDYWQEGIPHWELGGDAVATERYIRLTPKLNSKYGWIWNDQPNDNQNFEARLSFISRNRRVAQADGLALWLITNPNKETFSEPGPLAGMRANFQGIGIVLDTYDNDNRRDNPLVSLVVNMEGHHRTWDVDKDLLPNSQGRCTFDFRTVAEVASELIVTYLDKKLTVRMRNPERSLDTTCFEVDGIVFSPTKEYFFGVTATTGQIADNHDVVSLEVRPLGASIGDPDIPLEHHDHDKERSEQSFHREQKRKNPRWSEAPKPDEPLGEQPPVEEVKNTIPAKPALHATPEGRQNHQHATQRQQYQQNQQRAQQQEYQQPDEQYQQVDQQGQQFGDQYQDAQQDQQYQQVDDQQQYQQVDDQQQYVDQQQYQQQDDQQQYQQDQYVDQQQFADQQDDQPQLQQQDYQQQAYDQGADDLQQQDQYQEDYQANNQQYQQVDPQQVQQQYQQQVPQQQQRVPQQAPPQQQQRQVPLQQQQKVQPPRQVPQQKPPQQQQQRAVPPPNQQRQVPQQNQQRPPQPPVQKPPQQPPRQVPLQNQQKPPQQQQQRQVPQQQRQVPPQQQQQQRPPQQQRQAPPQQQRQQQQKPQFQQQ